MELAYQWKEGVRIERGEEGKRYAAKKHNVVAEQTAVTKSI